VFHAVRAAVHRAKAFAAVFTVILYHKKLFLLLLFLLLLFVLFFDDIGGGDVEAARAGDKVALLQEPQGVLEQ